MVNKYELTGIIERFAPPESAEPWDCSGPLIETERQEVQKVMLCLTLTEDILRQAKAAGCDMIISHHPLFTVPISFNQGVEIYCAHTNLDKAKIGTTETLIKKLGFKNSESYGHEFLRFCDSEMDFEALIKLLKTVSKNIRYTNPQGLKKVQKIAFCGGSGTEFWNDAEKLGAEVLVTGDLKFHTALDSQIAIIDIGHFESEVPVLGQLEAILSEKISVVIAKETSPIKQINS